MPLDPAGPSSTTVAGNREEPRHAAALPAAVEDEVLEARFGLALLPKSRRRTALERAFERVLEAAIHSIVRDPVSYTRIVRRPLHRLASLALLSVLSGAPAVAVLCAGLCAPAAHHQQTENPDSSCHGRTGGGPAVKGQPARDCRDHGTTVGAVASLVTSRSSDLAVMHPVDATAATVRAAFPSPDDGAASLAQRASPPLPARSRPILRI